MTATVQVPVAWLERMERLTTISVAIQLFASDRSVGRAPRLSWSQLDELQQWAYLAQAEDLHERGMPSDWNEDAAPTLTKGAA